MIVAIIRMNKTHYVRIMNAIHYENSNAKTKNVSHYGRFAMVMMNVVMEVMKTTIPYVDVGQQPVHRTNSNVSMTNVSSCQKYVIISMTVAIYPMKKAAIKVFVIVKPKAVVSIIVR